MKFIVGGKSIDYEEKHFFQSGLYSLYVFGKNMTSPLIVTIGNKAAEIHEA